MLCMLFHMLESQMKPIDPDWSKMPNPFSQQFQIAMMVGIAMHLFLWPVVLFARLFLLITKGKS